MCQAFYTLKLKSALPDSPAKEHSLSTIYTGCNVHKTQSGFHLTDSERLNHLGLTASSSDSAREQRTRPPVAHLPMLVLLVRCARCSFLKGIPEFLPALPFVTQHLQQSLFSR